MAIWLVRAGGHGEYEQKFIQEKCIYLTWDNLKLDLSKIENREALKNDLDELYSDRKPKTISHWLSQIWSFAHDMQIGDWVVLPLKSQRAIQIGEITGNYSFSPKSPNPFFHSRDVK